MLNIQEVAWSDIHKEVRAVNAELADICDHITPKHRYSLYKIKYPYGACIVDRGVFQLPTVSGELVPLTDESIPQKIREKFGYCSIPLSLILNNSSEVFIEANNRVIPLNFFNPGDFFGIFESMSALTGSTSDSIWTVTAGARSVFFLPKISDKLGHGRIKKKYGITADAPTDLLSQWEVFKAIYERVGSIKKWNNEILVFTNEWIKSDYNDISWLKFHKYLFKTSWTQSKLLRDSIEFGLLWASFSEVVSNKSLKPRPYIVDTLKHIISIANGSGVGFKPSIGETALPVKAIQEVYTNCYELKSYIPTIMQPCTLRGNEAEIYYSLAFPTTLESVPTTKNAPSIIEDEREIRLLLDILLKTINQVNPKIHLGVDIKYEFFHTDLDKFGELINSKEIFDKDRRFSLPNSTDRIFCATSLFFRGCIKIAKIS